MHGFALQKSTFRGMANLPNLVETVVSKQHISNCLSLFLFDLWLSFKNESSTACLYRPLQLCTPTTSNRSSLSSYHREHSPTYRLHQVSGQMNLIGQLNSTQYALCQTLPPAHSTSKKGRSSWTDQVLPYYVHVGMPEQIMEAEPSVHDIYSFR